MQQEDPKGTSKSHLSIKFCVNPSIFMLKLDTDDISNALEL